MAGYYVIPSEPFECLSVSASFPDYNLSSFWPIFFKLCMDIDIREEWFGIANRLNLFINNRVMALDWYETVFLLNIFRRNGWILIKYCMCMIYTRSMLYLMHIIFLSIFNRVMALDWRQNFIYAQYLELIYGFRSNFVYHMHWYWQDVALDDWTIFFIHFQQNYGPWLMSKFRLCSISCGPIDGLLIKFCKCIDIDNYNLFLFFFSTALWPLIDVRILFPFNILRTNWWFWWNFVYAVLWLTHSIVTNTWNFLELFNRVTALDWG